jgi:hypothetical protein
MSFNFPRAIPTLIPTDTNVRASRVSMIYPIEVLGSYDTWKLPVRVATTGNITLSGLQTIDGVAVVKGDRVLVKNQITASENGIYIVLSSIGATDFWLRSNDLQNGTNAANITMFVNEGTTYADLMIICTNNSGSDVVGINNLVFITYGDAVSVVPGGNPSDVQYNNNGAFGGSSFLTFDPSTIPGGILPISSAIQGTLSIGPTNSPNWGRITGKDAISSSGNAGSNLFISGGTGDGAGNGGFLALTGGYSTLGSGADINIMGGGSGNVNGNGGSVVLNGGLGSAKGGDISITSGEGNNFSGNINIVANSSAVIRGYILLTTYGIDTYFIQGGIQFTKDTDVSLTINNLAAPPTVTSSSRQGIITIIDPSAVGAVSSITITVNDSTVMLNDIIQVSIQEFNTAGTGIPVVIVSSITPTTGFTIQLYNQDAVGFSASQMKISFIMM